MRRSLLFPSSLVLLGLTLLLVAGAAPAEAQKGAIILEAFGGNYFPESDVVDDAPVYGLRVGYQIAKPCGILVSLGRAEFPIPIPGPGPDPEIDATLVDLSFLWTPRPGGRAEFFLLGGLGWSFLEADAGELTATDDSLTANGGLALLIHAGEESRVYFRPEVKARWYDEGGDIDIEATLALGFFFPRG